MAYIGPMSRNAIAGRLPSREAALREPVVPNLPLSGSAADFDSSTLRRRTRRHIP